MDMLHQPLSGQTKQKKNQQKRGAGQVDDKIVAIVTSTGSYTGDKVRIYSEEEKL